MDWSRRASSHWDFTRLNQEAAKNMNTGGGSSGGGDFSVDLKLGQVINGGGVKSSKRARGGGNANQPTGCLVDGCASDMSSSRDYHRRHKVCELHSKSPQVFIGGERQRFCQQCSRFHCLEEFDEGKRSCRKRLDGHNRRRRKPQPGIIPESAKIFSNYQGTQLLSFSGSHIHHSTNMAFHDWSDPGYLPHNFLHKHNLFLGSASYPDRYKQGKLLTFQAPACQSPLDTTAVTKNGEYRTNNLNDGFSMAVRESDCALSLLSSPQMQTSRTSISVLHQNPLGVSFNSARLDPMDSVLVSSVGNGGMNFSGGLFHLGLDGVGNEPPPTLPFHWE